MTAHDSPATGCGLIVMLGIALVAVLAVAMVLAIVHPVEPWAAAALAVATFCIVTGSILAVLADAPYSR